MGSDFGLRPWDLYRQSELGFNETVNYVGPDYTGPILAQEREDRGATLPVVASPGIFFFFLFFPVLFFLLKLFIFLSRGSVRWKKLQRA